MSKLKRLSEVKEVNFNMILSIFFMEDFLMRIEKSKYKDYFIFKGGFLLSSIFGISNRTTMDIDIEIKNLKLDNLSLQSVIEDIIQISSSTPITYEIVSFNKIRNLDFYGGINVKLIGHYENIKQPLSLDFATGDPITPGIIEHSYYPLIIENPIHIKSYSIESIISEKLHVIYIRGLANSRCKDYYDLYMFQKIKHELINFNNLFNAIINTFAYRETNWDQESFLKLLDSIANNDIMITRWLKYSNTHSYAYKIPFGIIIDAIKKLILDIQNLPEK